MKQCALVLIFLSSVHITVLYMYNTHNIHSNLNKTGGTV
jgi:hypothetical protein